METVNQVSNLPITPTRLQDVRDHTAADSGFQSLIRVIQEGWPERKENLPRAVVPYFNLRDELTTEDGVILKGQQIVIPQSLRADMLHRIHSSHVGIEGCCRRARDCVYWPGMSAAVKDFIEKCDICCSYASKQPKETLHPHVIPDRPWAKVGSDVFTFDGNDYLVTVDYYSNFWELDYLENTTSSTIIRKLKAQFARHGIPEIFMSDNASYYTSEEFHKFSRKWDFQMKTSSPGFPQSNGKAENAVKTAKSLMRKAKASRTDPYLAILDFRNTPTQGVDASPVQRHEP
ncbi:uncharacterized protein K02A2.6-like [Liolophura sinensis]|uniref:uncharacterized protein K02A2.6-like n=1 Tax=Liolophura sinensis TaxID=3198878 RepID=UPI0031581C22